MPGSWVSMPYLALPSTLSGMSTRARSLPMKRHLSSGLRSALLDLRHRVGHLRRLGDLPIAQLAAGLLVHDRAHFGRELGLRHFQHARGVGDQDLARLGAGEPHDLVIAGHGAAADGDHVAEEFRIAVELLVVGRGHDVNLGPIGIEVLGETGRQRGHGALAHFRRRRHDGGNAVAADGNPGIGREIGRRVGGQYVVEGPEADGDAGGTGGDQEAAARERLNMCRHDQAPAAFWMAEMMRV